MFLSFNTVTQNRNTLCANSGNIAQSGLGLLLSVFST